METLLTIVGLGLLGIGPVATTLLFAAINAGIERRKITAFTLAVLLSTVAVGMVLSVLTDVLFDSISRELQVDRGAIGAVVKATLALAIVLWLVHAIRTGRDEGTADPASEASPDDPSGILEGSTARFAMAGTGIGLSKVLDPTLIAASVILAELGGLLALVAGLAVFTLVSEVALFSLYVAYLLGAHEWLVTAVRTLWREQRRTIERAAYVIGFLVAVVLAVDAAAYFIGTG